MDRTIHGAKILGHVPELAEVFRRGRDAYDQEHDFQKRVLCLSKDVGRCNSALRRAPNDQFWRRSIIKNLFALLEGQLFGMKAIAFHQFGLREVEFSAAELTMLQEQRYKLNEKGEACSSTDNYQKLFSNYQFAFKCFAKSHGSSFQLNNGKIAKLKQLEAIRNRLTHPKRLNALDVSDDELKLCEEVWNWHSEQTCNLFKTCINNPLEVKQWTGKITGRFDLTHPFILLGADGTVYGFATRRDAMLFGKTNSENHPSRINFFLHSAEDLLNGVCKRVLFK